MLDYYIKVLLIMAVLAAFMLPGYILRKTNMLKAETLPALSNILLYVCQPVMFIKAFCIRPVPPTGDTLWKMLVVFLLSALGLLLVFLLAKVVFLRQKDRKRANVYTFLTVFSNCGFVGIPFMDMLTDGNSVAMMFMITFNVAFNFFVWTLGVYLMTGNVREISLKNAFLNPSTVGAAVALLFFLVPRINIFDMPAVQPLQQIVVYLSDMTAPLSMIIVGARAADLSLKEIFSVPADYLASLLRLVAAPAVMYLIMLPFRLSGALGDEAFLYMAPVICMAMTPASTLVAYAEKFDGDRRSAARSFILGTLLGIVTIPLVITLISL